MLVSFTFSSILPINLMIFVFQPDDFGTIEYVTIGVSLGLAAFIVVFIAFYWWRAQNAYPMDARERNAGIVSTVLATSREFQ